MRLDLYIVDKKLAESRTRAVNQIKLNAVTVNGVIVTKPAFEVKEEDVVIVTDKIKYCSLGGLKLEKAIAHFGLKILGTVIDIGASNGGFTDCLLSSGAERVYAVDVGENALPEKLTSDSRVIVMDKTNARNLLPSNFDCLADFITVDVSFISLTQILHVLAALLARDGKIVALIKPQFEAGRTALTQSGIVKNEKLRLGAVKKVTDYAKSIGLFCEGYCVAPMLFEDKNIEYLALFCKISA
ncbi:MAG: TlyA family RNA methyltransferase [Clostridia bacterium]|nr:TlyA family RNA methyltransferase [Clostridia bacterium]